MSNVIVFAPITLKNRAYAAELQAARDRMLLTTAELDEIRVIRADKSEEM